RPPQIETSIALVLPDRDHFCTKVKQKCCRNGPCQGARVQWKFQSGKTACTFVKLEIAMESLQHFSHDHLLSLIHLQKNKNHVNSDDNEEEKEEDNDGDDFVVEDPHFRGTYETEGHPHRVSLIQGTTYHGCCERCSETLKSKMIFKCLTCKFAIDIKCAAAIESKLFKRIWNEVEGYLIDTKNKTNTASWEMCICLKDHLDAQERIQHTSNLEGECLEIEQQLHEVELEMGYPINIGDEEIVLEQQAMFGFPFPGDSE
ncbi:hypothetical protein Tco_0371291, partial [Tanacetum coccineum]